MDDTSVEEVDHHEADSLSGHAAILWGTNARQDSQRSRQLLGWTPKGITLEEEIPQTVQAEAKRMGKL